VESNHNHAYIQLNVYHSCDEEYPILHTIKNTSGGRVVRTWDQEVCFLCGLRFKPCGCLYDGHWRLTWSLTSGSVGLVEVRANWPGHPR
jgi:hypothetical protein